MDLSLERDSSALGSLFQQIINDMKNTSPLWEDFVAKAGKLHTCLRAAIQAIAAYLDAFQKIADAATNSRGASKEIGTALTRVCLRHKAVETRLKTFTSAIMDCLVQPLQDRIEDWKRTVATIDKDHAKEYKRCRSELKKRSSDTLRLQKKARKGQTDGLQSLMDSHMQDVTLRRAELEEVEKKSLRAAMVEERLRYCSFVHMLQPVVHEECEVMSELGHLQEAMQSIALVTKEPSVLPQASEELIHDAKASINLYPESPGGGSGSQGGGCSNSLGSRKSSVCSISSMNSSGSSNSPGHHHYPRSLSQFVTPAIRLKPGESSDSGFCSSPALTTQTSNATNQTANVSTWPPHSQDVVDTLPPTADRPHTISTAYEKGHQRPPLTVYTFQNPETIHESNSCLNNGSTASNGQPSSGQATPATQKSPAASLSRPPLPVRCSSLERPLSAQSNHRQGSGSNLLQRQCPSPIPAHITKELSAAHHAQQQQQQQNQQQQQTAQTPPTYVNMSELATMAAMKLTNQQQQQQLQQQKASPPPLQQQSSIDSTGSQHSNDSSGSHQLLHHHQQHQHPHQQQHHQQQQPNHHSATATRSHSISSTASSLHSHPSIDSTVACGSLVGQPNHSTSTNTNTNTTTTSPSSGSSTPQNHYSPLLTNSPTSTAAGTPSGSSLGQGSALGFVYQVSSPTPPSSEVLKITEQAVQGAGQDHQGQANGGAEETDERSRASVLQKASMFEKAAAAAAVSPPAPIQIPSAAAAAAAASSPASGGGGRRSEAEQQEMGGAAGGGSTRIARRSSINQAKPPPPVRRSSSVTPGPNASVGLQQPQSQPLQQQQQNLHLSSSSEHLPPPPAFMLDAMPQMPASALKVSETVRALAAMRHQPASPVALRRMQQQQLQQQQQQLHLQQQQQPFLQSAHHSPLNDDPTATAYYDSYMDLHAYAHGLTNGQQPAGQVRFAPHNHQQQQPPQHSLYLQQQQHHQQPVHHQHQPPVYQAPPPADATFRTSSPAAGGAGAGGGGIYAQPKLVSSMSSFRTSSPSPNGHAHPLPPTQPKANPNLIAQLNARLSGKQQPHQPHQQHQQVEGIYGNQPQQQHQHQQPPGGESIYMRSGLSMSQPPQQQHYDGKSHAEHMQLQHQSQPQHRIYASFGTSSSASASPSPSAHVASNSTKPSILTPTTSFNALPHFPLSSSTSSLLSKVSSFSNSSSASPPPTAAACGSASSHYQPPQPPTAAAASSKEFATYSSSFNKNPAAAQQANMRHPHHQPPQQHYTCPPPLEDPPPPPIYSAGASATMPKKMARPPTGQSVSHPSAYAAATATLPKNLMQQQQHQQRLQQQQLHQQQQQQYQQPAGMGIGHGNGHVGQRPQLPLPQQKLRAAQQQHLAEQQQQLQLQQQQHHQQQQQQQHQPRQPPIPSRHSSVQQKIFVSTNPFVQTTAVKFHSPSASPTCGSPVTGSGSGSGSLASIYATTSRSGHHHQQLHHQQQQQQQQHYYRDVAGGNSNSNGGSAYYNHNAHAHHSNYATSTNIEKTGSIRAKTKAEFLENLNAKLAKQGMSGRAFAVRNLINSKALPDPRICHESLMDQIKRGATLKRNQKINDRSAPKIH